MYSENAFFQLSVLLAFLAGILMTLLLTGSIRTHFGQAALQPLPLPQPLYQPQPLLNPFEGLPSIEEPDEPLMPTQSYEKPQLHDAAAIPPAPAPAPNSLTQLLQGDINSLKIVPDSANTEEAREMLYKEFRALPSILQGNGSRHFYILFDPLCSHCHNLYKQLADGKAAQNDVTAHWIPSVAFLDNPSSQTYSQKLMTALLMDNTDLASQALKELMLFKRSALLDNPEWAISEEALFRVARNTVGLIQAGTGTPTSIFMNVSGKVEIIDGIPVEDDYQNIQPRTLGSGG